MARKRLIDDILGKVNYNDKPKPKPKPKRLKKPALHEDPYRECLIGIVRLIDEAVASPEPMPESHSSELLAIKDLVNDLIDWKAKELAKAQAIGNLTRDNIRKGM